MRLALVLALLLAPAVASARPITVGASYGMIQSKADASSDPNSQMTAFGRLGIVAVSDVDDLALAPAAGEGREGGLLGAHVDEVAPRGAERFDELRRADLKPRHRDHANFRFP